MRDLRTNRWIIGGLTCLVVAGAATLARADDEATKLAEKLLTAGAKMFDQRDAAGLAATYTDDATVTAYQRDSNSREIKTDVTVGRADIEKLYSDLFKNDATYHAKNTIDYARQPGPDVLVVGGHFTPDTEAADPINVPFVQVRIKKGDSWKIADLKLFILLDK